MSGNSIFNATVCIMGIFFLIIHVVYIILKREKRKDEKALLVFFIFTILHFATYLTFTLIKVHYTSDAFIIVFYTAFYIMNNMEVFLLFRYARRYMDISPKPAKILSIINIALLALFVILDIVNIFTGIFFTASGGVYLRSRMMILSQIYQFIIFATIFVVALMSKKLMPVEKTVFGFYCFLPLIAIVLQNIFKGYAIAYASIIIATEILFSFLSAQKNLLLAKEEEKNKEARIKLMLSQIKPHFVYNSLSSISTLIPIDPEKAQGALDSFTEYLRHNISSLTETRFIPFEEELKHIESYLRLEKLRFGDRVNVVYEINATGFYLPPLCIQPIVENAIKHGILKKLEGGNLTLRSYETDDDYVVEVIDDGVGFCIEDVAFDENRHFGLNNIRYRVEKTTGGEVRINSKIDQGTCVTVVFHKGENK